MASRCPRSLGATTLPRRHTGIPIPCQHPPPAHQQRPALCPSRPAVDYAYSRPWQDHEPGDGSDRRVIGMQDIPRQLSGRDNLWLGACSDATPTTHGRLGASLGAQNSGRAENIPPEIEGRYFRPTRPVLLQTPFACFELRWADPDNSAGAGHLIKPRTAREQASTTLVACWPVPPPPATTLTLASTEAIVSLSPARPGMDAVQP